jgi:hypothetical protein
MNVSARHQRRFILQSDNYSCGPVAIHNALVWQTGCAPNWREILANCQPCSEFGTDRFCILPGSIHVQTSKVVRMRQWLEQGHGFILLYCCDSVKCGDPECDKEWCGKEPHYIFVHPASTNFQVDDKMMLRNAICYQSAPDYQHTVERWINFEDLFLKQDRWHDSRGELQTYPLAWRIPLNKTPE